MEEQRSADPWLMGTRVRKRDLLEAELGVSWEQIEHLYDPDVVTEEALEEFENFVPWELAEPQFHEWALSHGLDEGSMLEGVRGVEGVRAHPDFDDPIYNPEGKLLLEMDREVLDHIVVGYEERLEELGHRAFAELVAAREEAFERKAYRKYLLFRPLAASGHAPKVGAFRSSYYANWGGWVFDLVVDSADYPELDDVWQEIKSMKQRRRDEIREYIASVP